MGQDVLMAINQQERKSSTSAGQKWIKISVFLGVIVAFALVYWFFGDQLNLKVLAEKEAQIRAFQQSNPILTYCLAFVIYVAVSGLSIPGGATVLTIVYGWVFGFWPTLVLVSFASTLGATLAFLTSRYLFRDPFQRRFADRLQTFNSALEREGAFYLFTLRMNPVFPFFVVNLVMGLTPIKTLSYWWVSQLGMLPGTAVFVFMGSSVSLSTLAEDGIGNLLPLFVAFAILGAFPLLAKWLLARLKARISTAET